MEYGLIGGRLGHSYSKLIHERLAGYTYELCPLAPEQLAPFMQERRFKGINVTIPYKRDVIGFLDSVDATAAQIGAVNTVVNRGGVLAGYNTDLPGFIYMVTQAGVQVAGKKVLVLGTGGASAAVLAGLGQLGAGRIVSVSRTGKGGAATYEECTALHTDASVIVNTTPVGMFPNTDASPLDLAPFEECTAVLDVIYNPGETKLTAQAKALGKNAATGLTMLVAQAKYACELFLDCSIPDEKISEITRQIAAEMYR